MTAKLAVVGMLVCIGSAGCVGEDPTTLGPQSSSGVVRLSESSFGLLIYPCVADHLVSEVVLLDVELDPATLNVVRTQTLLRERYREPVVPRDLILSTDPRADPARPDAEREVVDPTLLDRFNNDPDYLTAIDPPHFLTIDAFSVDGTEVGGTGSLQDRFSADVGEVAGFGSRPVAIVDVRCSGSEAPAWSVPAP